MMDEIFVSQNDLNLTDAFTDTAAWKDEMNASIHSRQRLNAIVNYENKTYNQTENPEHGSKTASFSEIVNAVLGVNKTTRKIINNVFPVIR